MIRLLFTSIFIFPLTALCQTKFDTADIRLKYSSIGPVYYFLDSQWIDINKTYFDYFEVDSIMASKEILVFYATRQICRIDLLTKNKNRKLVRLTDLSAVKSHLDIQRNTSFVIDETPIYDTSKVLIDPDFIQSISEYNSKSEDSKEPGTYFIINTKRRTKKNGD